jgi:hypothetical protein
MVRNLLIAERVPITEDPLITTISHTLPHIPHMLWEIVG